MLRPSTPASASAAAENRMALLAKVRRNARSAPRVISTNGTRILIGPIIRNSMRNILRAPKSDAVVIEGASICACAGTAAIAERASARTECRQAAWTDDRNAPRQSSCHHDRTSFVHECRLCTQKGPSLHSGARARHHSGIALCRKKASYGIVRRSEPLGIDITEVIGLESAGSRPDRQRGENHRRSWPASGRPARR